MKQSKLLFLLIALHLIFFTVVFGQVDTAWVRRYNGTGNHNDWATDMVVDGQGNVYVTGRSEGTDTYYDWATVKYNASGVQQWVSRYSSSANLDDEGSCIALDGQGNIYVAGYTTKADSSSDYLTVKYNPNGDTLWTRAYNGPGDGDDFPSEIAVDGQGNVYITGESEGSSTDVDWATIKYNSSGVEQWVARQNGTADLYDAGWGIAVDSSENVYVTGQIENSASNSDILTVKYNSNGDTLWTRTYNGPANGADCGNAIALDVLGNIYITAESDGSGSEHDYVTIKYSGSGTQQWVSRYNGPGNGEDFAVAIALDNQGNSYITGLSTGNGYNFDYATIKYNSNGDTVWVRRYDGLGNGDDRAWSIAVDGQGDVYITGDSYYGDSVLEDYVTIKYSASGIQQWLASYDGTINSHDYAARVLVDSADNVYVTGSTDDTVHYDYGTIKYVQLTSMEERTALPLVKTNDFEIYPNPAKSYFAIHIPQSADHSSLKIFDVSGKLIKEIATPASPTRNDGMVRVSLQGINPGIYFIQAGNETKTTKLVITK
jgi:hypothetical protein